MQQLPFPEFSKGATRPGSPVLPATANSHEAGSVDFRRIMELGNGLPEDPVLDTTTDAAERLGSRMPMAGLRNSAIEDVNVGAAPNLLTFAETNGATGGQGQVVDHTPVDPTTGIASPDHSRFQAAKPAIGPTDAGNVPVDGADRVPPQTVASADPSPGGEHQGSGPTPARIDGTSRPSPDMAQADTARHRQKGVASFVGAVSEGTGASSGFVPGMGKAEEISVSSVRNGTARETSERPKDTPPPTRIDQRVSVFDTPHRSPLNPVPADPKSAPLAPPLPARDAEFARSPVPLIPGSATNPNESLNATLALQIEKTGKPGSVPTVPAPSAPLNTVIEPATAPLRQFATGSDMSRSASAAADSPPAPPIPPTAAQMPDGWADPADGTLVRAGFAPSDPIPDPAAATKRTATGQILHAERGSGHVPLPANAVATDAIRSEPLLAASTPNQTADLPFDAGRSISPLGPTVATQAAAPVATGLPEPMPNHAVSSNGATTAAPMPVRIRNLDAGDRGPAAPVATIPGTSAPQDQPVAHLVAEGVPSSAPTRPDPFIAGGPAPDMPPVDPSAAPEAGRVDTAATERGRDGPPPPIDPKLPRQVSHQLVEIARHHPAGPVELALNPEELGRVRMTLAATDTGITVTLTTERPETADLMRRNLDMLGQDFRALGYRDVTFDFSGTFDGAAGGGHARPRSVDGPGGEPGRTDRDDTPAPHMEIATGAGLDLRL